MSDETTDPLDLDAIETRAIRALTAELLLGDHPEQDTHPEHHCHRCGRPNVHSWYADSATWNEVHGGGGPIWCPPCFTAAHEQITGRRTSWRLAPSELADEQRHLISSEATMRHERDAARAEAERLRSQLAGCVWAAPGRMAGEPCVGGTRVPAASVAAVVGDGGPDTINPADVPGLWLGVTAAGAQAATWWTHRQATRDRWVAADALRQFADDEEADPVRCTWGYPALMRQRADRIESRGLELPEVDHG